MLNLYDRLGMISHSSDGSDKLLKGIHLRWGFNRKMGFPTGGFKLYRRIQSRQTEERSKIDFEQCKDDVVADELMLPFNSEGRQYSCTFTSVNGYFRLYSQMVEGIRRKTLGLPRENVVKVRLPVKVQQLEIDISFNDNWEAEIRAYSGNLTVAAFSEKKVGKHTFCIGASDVDSLEFIGHSIFIVEMRFYVIHEIGYKWDGPINLPGGFGLPVNIDLSILKSMYALNPGLLYSGKTLEDEVAIYGTDWVLTSMRISKKYWRRFRGRIFKEIRELLGKMLGNGTLPASWPLEISEASETGTGDAPTFSFPIYDFILLSSVDPNYARILGLYWLDRNVVSGLTYDYKIVGNWTGGSLWNLENRVNFNKLDIGYVSDSDLFAEGLLMKLPRKSTVTEIKGLEGIGIEKALAVGLENGGVTICLPVPSRTVQLYVSYRGDLLIDGIRNGNKVTAWKVSALGKKLIQLEFEDSFDSLFITGIPALRYLYQSLTFYSIAYDSDYINSGEYTYVLRGVKYGRPDQMQVPQGLTAEVKESYVSKDLNGVLGRRYRVSLDWKLPQEEYADIKNFRTGYHVVRYGQYGTGNILTIGRPLTASRAEGSIYGDGKGLYQDALSSPGTYRYMIQGVDIWGRTSGGSRFAEVEVKRELPQPPSAVEAKYIDPETLGITKTEKEMLTNKGNKPLIYIRWKWTAEQKLADPLVTGFNVYFQPGWLNNIPGTILYDAVESQGMTELFSDYLNNSLDGDALKGCTVTIKSIPYKIASSRKDVSGRFIFRVNLRQPGTGDFVTCQAGTFAVEAVSNAGAVYELLVSEKVLYPGLAGDTVGICGYEATVTSVDTTRVQGDFGQAVRIYISKQRFTAGTAFNITAPADTKAFIDYSKHSAWAANIGYKSFNNNSPAYEMIIEPPPIEPTSSEMVLYGQLAVAAVNDIGIGPVSVPASIMAVYREKPPVIQLPDVPGSFTGFADYKGNAPYALRFPKVQGLSYDIYRAMDETLFAVDSKVRAWYAGKNEERIADIPKFLADLGLTQYSQEIADKVISPASIDYGQLKNDPLKNVLLKALSNLKGNEDAFVRINSSDIRWDESRYANKVCYFENLNTPIDQNMLLYIDDSLVGNSKNVYFYRIRTKNAIGTLGDFGVSGFPVYVRRTHLELSPAIISAESLPGSLKIKWNKVHEAGLAGYAVYRTDDGSKACDIRRMDRLNTNGAGIVLNMDPPSLEDSTAEPYKKYYCRVVALVEINEGGVIRTIQSRPSEPVAAMSLAPMPQPAVWVKALRPSGTADGEVLLEWSHPDGQNTTFLVERLQQGDMFWKPVGTWTEPGVLTTTDCVMNYKLTVKYRIRVKDRWGRLCSQLTETTIAPQP